MGKDIETKKRKAASIPESGAEKVKKVKKVDATAPVKKRKATEDAGVAEVKKPKTTSKAVIEKPSKAKATKKTPIADKPEPATNSEAKSPKPTKKAANADKPEPTTNGDSKASKSSKKTAKVSKKSDPEPDTEESEPAAPIVDDAEKANGEEDESDFEVDDQTEALLKGFESEGDDEDESNEQGLASGQEVPKVELSKKDKKKLQKAIESAASDKPGVIYVGRIPHGFYEHEMREYFKQFGTILKLRLSRNRKTGASKHYAFIQFESATVADIVSKTMDNYLLFGHLLKVKVVPDEQLPEDLFKGANKRFKKVPWNKMEGRKLSQGVTEEEWEKRIERMEEKRSKNAEKLKDIGYEFEAPKIKSAKGVAKKHVETPALIENSDAKPQAIEAVPVIEEPSESKATKTVNEVIKEADDAPAAEESSKPKKKEKKSKAKKDVGAIAADELTPVVAEEPKPAKSKKTKAAKAVEVAADIPAPIAEDEEVTEKPKEKKAKKVKASKAVEALAEETPAPVAEDDEVAEKPKEKRNKKTKAAKAIESVTEEVATPIVDEEVAENPKEKKAKKTEAKVVEDGDAPAEKVKKSKKAKKEKAA
ncbi:hypothetical protein G7Y89_g9374 [Cudoniella acicularis]|uniref:RRM domain-containing protein n=1 Tax=Cudoniella acicularis TaxID=354080 RepID=A0A8H4VZP8_9HELO|nr:hypothetical protein G7Y89_g9374 [Cudoniella acicularis]